MKSRVLYAVVILGLVFGLAACQSGGKAGKDCAPNCTYADMTLCYPQLGAESDWRTANTASFKETAESLGFNLIFSDAQQTRRTRSRLYAPASSNKWM
jgi:simple sugar transport system substrate-binding protein